MLLHGYSLGIYAKRCSKVFSKKWILQIGHAELDVENKIQRSWKIYSNAVSLIWHMKSPTKKKFPIIFTKKRIFSKCTEIIKESVYLYKSGYSKKWMGQEIKLKVSYVFRTKCSKKYWKETQNGCSRSRKKVIRNWLPKTRHLKYEKKSLKKSE